MFICLFNEVVDDISVGVQERNYVLDITFQTSGLFTLLSNICVSILAMKMFAKATAFRVTMVVPCYCEYFCSSNWNDFLSFP